MSNIIRKVAFLLVLAGLLTWGVATMAQAPAVNSSVDQISTQTITGTMHEGQEMENGVEVSRDQIRPMH